MNPNEIGMNELTSRLAAQLLRTTGTGVYGDAPWVMDVFPGIGRVVYGLSGGYFQRPYTIADDLTITLAQEEPASARTEWLPEFQTAFSGDDNWKGLIFRVGKFAERIVEGKPLEITSEQIRKVVSNFAGFIPLHVDHNQDSVMADVLKAFGAGIVNLWHNEDATELHAEIRRPSWLATAFEKFAKKVSVRFAPTWDRLTELSLVKSPRIHDAALYSAFMGSPDFATYATSHPEEAKQIVTKASAHTPPSSLMNENETLQAEAYFRANPDAARAAGLDPAKFAAPAPAPAPAPTNDANPALDQANARIKAIEGRLAQMGAQEDARSDEADALNFYADELQAGRATPPEKDDVLRQFRTARTADRAQDPATFDASKGHVADLKASFAKRAPRFVMGAARISSQDDALTPSGGTKLALFQDGDFDNAGLTKSTVNA